MMRQASEPLDRLFNRLLPAVGLIAALPAALSGQPCDPVWADDFPSGHLGGAVLCLTDFDADGTGPLPLRLVAGGDFATAGGRTIPRIAMWDGQGWAGLGIGITAIGSVPKVWAAAVFDEDGTGPAAPVLIVCGTFDTAGGMRAEGIARWDGSAWSSLGTPVGFFARCLAVHDDDGDGPSPPALYVGGAFASAGISGTARLARWDGSNWSSVGGGFAGGSASTDVRAMASADLDGPGPAPSVLVVGGNFAQAGAVTADCLAAWNGSSWTSLNHVNGPVNTLSYHDEDGAGPGAAKVFVGAGSGSSNAVKRLDGLSWTTIGASVAGEVLAMASRVDGAGPPSLYVGGSFAHLGGAQNVNGIAKWDGAVWSAVGTGVGAGGTSPRVNVIRVATGAGVEGRLLAGGAFTSMDTLESKGIAAWNDSVWRPLGNGIGGRVHTLGRFDRDGAGPSEPALIIGGVFRVAGQTSANGIVSWDGLAYSALGAGVSGTGNDTSVDCVIEWDEDGPGPGNASLVVGGTFTSAGGGPAARIARWNGAAWMPMGAGFDAKVTSLAVYDDGSGPRLYAGGVFNFSGLAAVRGLARWTGASWVQVPQAPNGVAALAVFDDDAAGPTPPAMYVAGSPLLSGGGPLARWDGSNWSSPAPGTYNGGITSLTVVDEDGEGGAPPQLMISGSFTTLGGLVLNRAARWTGAALAPVGFGVQNGVNGETWGFATADDDAAGSNPPALFVAGEFGQAGTTPAVGIARFEGGDWYSVSSGVSDPTQPIVRAIRSVPEPGLKGEVAAVYIAGQFQTAGGVSSGGLARWGCPRVAACYANCDGSTAPPVLNVQDFACFLNRYAAGEPSANCDGSTAPPTLNVLDFACFLNSYAAGCP